MRYGPVLARPGGRKSVYRGHVLAPQPRGRGGRVERPTRRLEQQVGPATRHHVHVLVTAAPGQQPAPARVLVGEPVDRGVRGALRVDGQLQAG